MCGNPEKRVICGSYPFAGYIQNNVALSEKSSPPLRWNRIAGVEAFTWGALTAAHGLQVQKVRGPRRESLQQNTAGQVRLGHRDG